MSVFHERPALLEQVASRVGLLRGVAHGMGKSGLSHRPQCVRTLHAQVLKLVLNPCTVALSARPVARSNLVNVMSLRPRPGIVGDGNTQARVVITARVGLFQCFETVGLGTKLP